MTRLLALLREPMPDWEDLTDDVAGRHALAVVVAAIALGEALLLTTFAVLWCCGWRDA